MKLRVLSVAVLLAVPVIGAPGPAHACDDGNQACRLVNRVCDLVVGPCIP